MLKASAGCAGVREAGLAALGLCSRAEGSVEEMTGPVWKAAARVECGD